MLPVVLGLHSVLRWVVVIAGLIALIYALVGWLGRRPWTSSADVVARIFSTSMELQVLIGIVLFAVSPLVMSVLGDFGEAMRNTTVRFFAIEHVVGMVFALGMIHMGRTLAKKAASPDRRYRLVAIFNLIALLVILAMVPWPFTTPGAGRPWLRL